MKYAIAKCKTKLKASSLQSSELPPEQIIEIEAGEIIPIKSVSQQGLHVIFDCQFYAFNDHWQIHEMDRLDDTNGTLLLNHPVEDLGKDPIKIKAIREGIDGQTLIVTLESDGIVTVLKESIRMIELAPYKSPLEADTILDVAKPVGKSINIPGIGTIPVNSPIIPGGHFNWAEATKNGTRIPINAAVSGRIVAMAKRMEDVRKNLGDRPIQITSWYRPPAINRAVGGASQSRHLSGDAVDFTVSGLPPSSVQKLLEWWDGGLGYGKTFTHLDNRGYRSRWNYG